MSPTVTLKVSNVSTSGTALGNRDSMFASTYVVQKIKSEGLLDRMEFMSYNQNDDPSETKKWRSRHFSKHKNDV